MKIIHFVVIVILAAGLLIPANVLSDVAVPKKQTNAGVSPEKVFCKENLYKLILKSSNKPICVKPETAKKLIERGITKATDTQIVTKFIDQLKNKSSVGTIKKLTTVKIPTSPGIASTAPPTAGYHVVFEVCGGEQGIIAPEVIITSDTETRYVKLVERLLPNSCEVNAGKIKAANSDSINLTLVNKGGVTAKITQLENKVKELQEKLDAERTQLGTRVKQANEITEGEKEKITKIVEMRNELNKAREELNRYLFALNLVPKIKSTDLDVKKSFAGIPLEGVFVNKLGVAKQIVTEGSYDVVFEMCADKQIVRVPVVTVKSDIETKQVKMADKIIQNTCQVTGAKIKATNPDSIEVSAGDTAEKSITASELEKKLSDLTESLRAEKQALRDLTHFAPRPADFNDQ
ncbi:MAG TPA: hypothetical protein VFG25_03020, partial [Nitrosopumilaceae archaeon]|nr:hypothetical protein [Nitrosopumilaceae archaeon]